MAWEQTSANGGSAGGDRVSLGEFRSNLFANLTQLRSEILQGTYRTSPFRKVAVPKRKPGYRVLTIPSVRDRVLHKSIANALTPILEPIFEDCSFGYRPGRGVVHAVERVERWRKQGYSVVIEADIVSYFDNVDHELLIEKIQTAIGIMDGAASVLALLIALLGDQANALGTPGRGLVQGSPLSPLLANLYLDALDEEIEAQGVKLVRYADDFVILCKSQGKAKKVLQHCTTILAEHNLRLHEDGTRIVSFDQGFDFIGYLFVKSLSIKEKREPNEKTRSKAPKSEITDEGIIELDELGTRFDPGARVLHLVDPAHQLEIRNRSFSVQRGEGIELITIPHKRIGRIEVSPGIAVSSGATTLAMDTQTPMHFLDWQGQTRGLLASTRSRSAGLQFDQAAMILDNEKRLGIAKLLVDARIRNQRTQIQRLNRRKSLDKVEHGLLAMKRNLRKLPQINTVSAALGLEGASGQLFWPMVGSLLDNHFFQFKTRSRPARDPCNATLNYLAGILERDIRGSIQKVGLHPGFAFLHASRDRHDGLVFDLMEPFRAPLTEGLMVYLFNAKRLREEMFEIGSERDIAISTDGRKAIVEAYENAVAKRVRKPDGTGKLSWRNMMVWQARTLTNAIRNHDETQFQPFIMQA
ncbi:CRISPR-associated endonuclease Cas1 [Pseudahrensia aquimaris]|uniref:CRISPR-associated endonuclease Cas1 n=1 Tax=Pseudahrensia aquimaris TaxID=744461 RepID=A0ABW3FBR6_9HYPH